MKKEEKSSGGGGGGVSQVEVKRAEGKRRATKLILDDDDDDDDEDNEATQPPADRYGRVSIRRWMDKKTFIHLRGNSSCWITEEALLEQNEPHPFTIVHDSLLSVLIHGCRCWA